MGNASVASRDLKIEQSPELSAKVVEKLNQVCAKDPQMLLITAIDDTMRAIGKNNISYVTASMNSTRFLIMAGSELIFQAHHHCVVIVAIITQLHAHITPDAGRRIQIAIYAMFNFPRLRAPACSTFTPFIETAKSLLLWIPFISTKGSKSSPCGPLFFS